MASKILLFILGLTIVAVAYGAWTEETTAEDSEDITVEDLMEYLTPMEKRGSKIGKCMKPDGKPCAICNLKVKNKMDMRRYVACGNEKSKSRKI